MRATVPGSSGRMKLDESQRTRSDVMATDLEAEVTALRIIMSNVVGRMAALSGDGRRSLLEEMTEQCKLAAERNTAAGPDRAKLVGQTRTYLDEFFKGITIT